MKRALVFALILLASSCQKKDPAAEIEKELFPFLVTNQNPSAPRCDPAFVTLRDEELTVICHALDTTDNEMKDFTKRETTAVTLKWTEARKMSFKNINTRFLDEITAQGKK